MSIVRRLLEIELGGEVTSDQINDVAKQHDYTNPQLDLWDELPTLDPNLPNTMEIVGKIGELRIVIDSKRSTTDCDDYYLFYIKEPVMWIALCNPGANSTNHVDVAHDISHFFDDRGIGKQVKSIYLAPEFRGQNLGLKMYYWLLKNVCDYIVADTMHTYGGERLWKKMLNSRRFHVEVFDTEKYISRKRWVGKDFKQIYNTDGRLIPWVTLPEKLDYLLDHEEND